MADRIGLPSGASARGAVYVPGRSTDPARPEPAAPPRDWNVKFPPLRTPRRARARKVALLAMIIGGLALIGATTKPIVMPGAGSMLSRLDPAIVTTLASAICMILAGFLVLLGILRGLPRVSVSAWGVRMTGAFASQATAWEDLLGLEIELLPNIRRTRPAKVLRLIVRADRRAAIFPRTRSWVIPDVFLASLEEIAWNCRVRRRFMAGEFPPQRAAPPKRAEAGIADFRAPWLTLALILVLTLIFVLELAFPIAPAGAALAPAVPTLVAFGGLMRRLVLDSGDWYRLVTSAFLHGSLPHLLSNGIVLFFTGLVLERLIGRAWLATVFLLSAIGGAAVSMLFIQGEVVSVGASGALMGMLAVAVFVSFRLPPDSPLRRQMMRRGAVVLVLSLVPTSGTGGLRVDYLDHAGGAAVGTLLGILLLSTWPRSSNLPGLRIAALAGAALSAVLVLGSAAQATRAFQHYPLIRMVPDGKFPNKPSEMIAQADALLRDYPADPRVHMAEGLALEARHDAEGAEREMRAAVRLGQEYGPLLRPQAVNLLRAELALMLLSHHQLAAARQEIAPVCAASGETQPAPDMMRLLRRNRLCE